MMNEEELLDKDIQNFINENLNADVTKLALLKNKFSNINWADILNQITAKQKSKTKLPTWYHTENILYPTKISIEQTSSESTAEYKLNIVNGESIIDLTGGFGIDAYYFSKIFAKVIHCEINESLSNIVNKNFKTLDALNIICKVGDSSEILSSLNQKFNWIYVDPSRRNDSKGKVFRLEDCVPNVPKLLNVYFKYSDKILIKNSPILDISLAISELRFVKKIYIIALENEVKELLIEIENNYCNEILIEATNIQKGNIQKFENNLKDDDFAKFSLPQKYLYEPNSAIMKAGLFNAIGNKFELNKIHQHAHIYTSNELINHFPGRVFEIESHFEFSNQNANALLKNKKMNVTTRNFNLTVENLRKKYKILDGGTVYTFATTNCKEQKTILICKKIY